MEEKSLGDELWDAVWDVGKFIFICLVVIGLFYFGIWMFLQDRYYDVQNDLDGVNMQLIAKGDAFEDAVTLLDYDNSFETYQEYKALCEQLRIGLNNAPPDAISSTKFDTLKSNVYMCQENIDVMGEKIILLRLGKPILE